MAKPAETSRRSARIDSIRSKLEASKTKKISVASTPVTTVMASNAFTSLNHLLNATALYGIGEYDRATAAFQRAMASDDAPEMLESLENAQLDGEADSVDTDTMEVAPVTEEDEVVESDLDDDVVMDEDPDYLSDEFESDDLEIDDGDMSELDVDTDTDDLTFDEDDEDEQVSVVKSNLAAIAAAKKISMKR